MRISLGDISIGMHGNLDNRSDGIPLLLLHGFTLSGAEWEPVFPLFPKNIHPLAPDLIGHGESDTPSNPDLYTVKEMAAQIDTLMDVIGLDRAHFAGYSMGGRVLLRLAFDFPDRIASMVLESTTPGIADQKEREQRIIADDRMAEFILRNPVEKFVERWMEHPIFNTQRAVPGERLDWLRSLRLKNSSVGMANSMRFGGRGSMEPLWTSLGSIRHQALVLAGHQDEKHTAIAKNMCATLADSVLHIIRDAGHNIHFERPEKYVEIISDFIQPLQPGNPK